MSKPIKVCQVASGSSITELQGMLDPYGNYEISNICESDTDVMLGWSVTVFEATRNFHRSYAHVPMVNYNWDIYSWVWDNPREGEYDYKAYGELLKESTEIWVPSEAEKKRTKKWFGLDSVVVKTACPYFDHPTKDGRYILNPLRRIPDKNLDWFEKACDELGLPYKSTDHQHSLEEFNKLLAECTFMVSTFRELSTGGLSLIEGYYLGKSALLADSPGHGGVDYLGDKARYFKYNNFEDLKRKLLEMWENPPKINIKQARNWVEKNYSKQAMGLQIHKRIQSILNEDSRASN
jgi:hypothetical protein